MTEAGIHMIVRWSLALSQQKMIPQCLVPFIVLKGKRMEMGSIIPLVQMYYTIGWIFLFLFPAATRKL